MINWKEKKLTERITSKKCKYVGMLLLAGLLCLPRLLVSAEMISDESLIMSEMEENGGSAVMTTDEAKEKGWVDFYLMCNEGMSNRGGNSGNTSMVVAMNGNSGTIRLMMFAWDTFVEYEGYDLPQKLDMAYRNNGPEETVKVFNANFDLGVEKFLSLNYLNLATLIDDYDGVVVNVSRAERNALNQMVASKKENIQAKEDTNLLEQIAIEMMAKEYYLNEFGPDTQLNGLQAVGFGWLQYDSVYNCCEREVEVVAGLFRSVGHTLSEEVLFFTDEAGKPEIPDNRRLINLDDVTDEDMTFLRQAISPIFSTSYHNLTEEEISGFTLALAWAYYKASRQGVNILERIETTIFPLEVHDPYVRIGGVEGHLVDKEANSVEMRKFLYTDEIFEEKVEE